MEHVNVEVDNGIASLVLERGKVNALIGVVVDELFSALRTLEGDDRVRAIILTGRNRFFSFGFDIPEFITYPKERFTEFVVNFTDLYSYLFLYPKPVVAALNGHAVAGGCMLAMACDRRVMVSGKAKISLNEISFGSSVFAGATEILRFQTGSKNAAEVLYSGAMYQAEDAQRIGLVDKAVEEEMLMRESVQAALPLAEKHTPAFKSIKRLLREPIVEGYRSREMASIEEFVDIWYSESTWENLKGIQIR